MAISRDEALAILSRLQQFYERYPQSSIDTYNDESVPKPGPLFERESAHVYLVKGRDGLHKIGVTSDLKTRMSALRSQWKTSIEIIHTVFSEDALNLEYSLHELFRSKSVGHEWFKLTDEDVAIVVKRM